MCGNAIDLIRQAGGFGAAIEAAGGSFTVSYTGVVGTETNLSHFCEKLFRQVMRRRPASAPGVLTNQMNVRLISAWALAR